MDCIVHGVAKDWTRLSDFHFTLAFNNSWSHILFCFTTFICYMSTFQFSFCVCVCSFYVLSLEIGILGVRCNHSLITSKLYLFHETPKTCPFNVIFVEFPINNHWVILILKTNICNFECFLIAENIIWSGLALKNVLRITFS